MKTKHLIFLTVFLTVLFICSFAFAGSQQTSSTLASTIITNARYYLNESSASFWADAELLVHVNTGSVDIVARTHCLEAIEDETLVENQLAYSLSDSFIVIKGVIYNGVKALKKGSIESIGTVQEIGEPGYWTQWGSSVYVYPPPDSNAAGNTISVLTISRPASVASNENVKVPAYYDKALTLYVVAQALKKDRRYAESHAVYMEYLTELDRFRTDFSYQPSKEQID